MVRLMARVVQIPKRAEAPAEAPLFSREQAHILAAEKLASFRKGKAWGAVIASLATLISCMIVLAFYSAVDAESDAAAVTASAVTARADTLSREMDGWLQDGK